MDTEQLAKAAYRAYGGSLGFRNVLGTIPMPEWEALPFALQKAWEAAVIHVQGFVQAAQPVALVEREQMPLDSREQEQIKHALNYADYHASAGAPGHGQFMLIAKLARALGLS